MVRKKSLVLLMPFVLLSLTLAITAGCGSKSESTGGETATNAAPSGGTESATPAAPAAGPVSGADIFKTRCALCHGPDGHGDGPSAKALNPKPRNFHDKAYMSTRPDDSLLAVIHNGKGAMPKWGGVLKEEEIAAVLKHIRDLGEKP